MLVHVCRRWRSLVFRSPRRLNLRLYCTPKTPAKHTLDVWPALPLIVGPGGETYMDLSSDTTDNVIAAHGQSNRVCKVSLTDFTDRHFENVFAAMQVPFPELTDLQLGFSWHLLDNGILSAIPIPDSFLGGSARPRLQNFSLSGIPFPGLPKVLLSATHLVTLRLSTIPHSGYISPEATVALLSALSSLDTLSLRFQSPQSRPDLQSQSPALPKRSILPAPSTLDFKGVTEYLEELVTRIDAPQLGHMDITFFNQIDFDCPRLAQFIKCTPTLMALDEAHVLFNLSTASVDLRKRKSDPEIGFHNLQISTSCRSLDWQLSSIEQFCNSSLHPISTVEDLYITRPFGGRVWYDDSPMKTLWLDLLFPFTAVKNLYLLKDFAPDVVAALEELVGGRITEVLPSLESILWRGSTHRSLSRKALGSSLPRDSSPITLSPFLTGIGTKATQNRRDADRKLRPMLSGFHIHLISL